MINFLVIFFGKELLLHFQFQARSMIHGEDKHGTTVLSYLMLIEFKFVRTKTADRKKKIFFC